MDHINDLERYIKRRLEYAERRAKECEKNHGDNPCRTHTYYAGKDLGYWTGMCEAYDNILGVLDRRS